MTRASTCRRLDGMAVALFWALAVVMFWRVLFAGGALLPLNVHRFEPWLGEHPGSSATMNPLMGDALLLTYPWREYSAEGLRAGELRFWNPYVLSGYPHLAALQSNALYPPVIVCDLLDPVAGMGYAMALHFGLAGTLMFWFLRRSGLEVAAATLGGIVFELNGFFMVRMSAPSYVFSGVWLPLLLLGCLQLLRGESWWSGAWKVAVASALGLLGGHPQILVLTLVVSGVYSLCYVTGESSKGTATPVLAMRLARIALALVLGLGLAGAQVLPFVELLTQTGRSEAPLGAYQRLGLPFVALAQAVVPDLFGHPVDDTYWLQKLDGVLQSSEEPLIWGWNYCGQNLYTGVAPLLLALLAVGWSRRPLARWFGGMASLSLLLVLGAPGVLHVVYLVVPSFSHSRSDRILYVLLSSVAILAACGWETIQSRERLSTSRWGLLLLSLPVLGGLAQVVRGWWGGKLGELWRIVGEQLAVRSAVPLRQLWEAVAVALAILVAGWLVRRRRCFRWPAVIVVLILTSIPLLRFGWRFNPVQRHPFPSAGPFVEQIRSELGPWGRLARWRSSEMPANLAQVYRLFDANGVSNAALSNYMELISEIDRRAFQKEKYFRTFRAPFASLKPLLDYLGVRAIVSSRSIPGLEPLPRVSPSPLLLYRNAQAFPRFFLVDCIDTYEDVAAARRVFHSGSLDLRQTALVRAEQAERLLLPCSGADAGLLGDVRIDSYGAHEIELEVDARSNSLLVSSEVDYPGWQVEVDHEPAQQLLVNTAFRGVWLPAGRHRVRFVYVASSFRWGVVLCLASVVGFVLVGLAVTRRGEPS